MNYKTTESRIIETLFKNANQVTDKFSKNDLLIEQGNITFIGEVKTRNFLHNQYEWILEKDKKEALFNKAEKYNNSKILYINYFIDGILAVWDLSKLFKSKTVKKGKQYMNKHSTEGFNRYGEKVEKEVYYLDVEDAIFKEKINI